MWAPSSLGEDADWTGVRVTKYKRIESTNPLVDNTPGRSSQPVKSEVSDMYLWVSPSGKGGVPPSEGTSTKTNLSDTPLPMDEVLTREVELIPSVHVGEGCEGDFEWEIHHNH